MLQNMFLHQAAWVEQEVSTAIRHAFLDSLAGSLHLLEPNLWPTCLAACSYQEVASLVAACPKHVHQLCSQAAVGLLLVQACVW